VFATPTCHPQGSRKRLQICRSPSSIGILRRATGNRYSSPETCACYLHIIRGLQAVPGEPVNQELGDLITIQFDVH
jgi:hypothetical protein